MVSLAFGFVVDALTLQRIDAWRENLWVAGNLFLVGVCIIVLNRKIGDKGHFWFSNIIQFSFGALLGSVFIFYFRSAALTASWPFLLLLLGAMLANEFFQKKYERLAFQLSFFYFSLFSFCIFLVPLVAKEIGPSIFVLSGGVSLFILWVYIFVLHHFVRERFLESRTNIWVLVTAIFIGINALYFANLIPPIPLSMKDSGVYHSIIKDEKGDYVVLGEPRGWDKYFALGEKVHWQSGETLYVYTAIFSPGSLNTDIVHDWQYREDSPSGEEWISVTRTPLHLAGGRSGGFRTYSGKSNFFPGFWRVDVETPYGQLIGRINFEVVLAEFPPVLFPVVKK
jgi:hypothetical protein